MAVDDGIWNILSIRHGAYDCGDIIPCLGRQCLTVILPSQDTALLAVTVFVAIA